MRNGHYIAGGIIAFITSQTYYWLHNKMADYDTQLGLPDLPFNPFARLLPIANSAVILTLASIIAHSALQDNRISGWSKAIWVFIGLGAWNQFIDALMGQWEYSSIAEAVFFIFSVGAAIITFKKWQKK